MKAGVVILSLFLVAAFSCVGLAQQSGMAAASIKSREATEAPQTLSKVLGIQHLVAAST